MKTAEAAQCKGASMPDLKVTHKVFVKAFISNGFNATSAYLTAFGCSENTARRAASRLLTNVDIQVAIRNALDGTLEALEITSKRVLEEIAKMAFCNMGDYITINDEGTAHVDLSGVKGKKQKTAAIVEITSETYLKGRGDDGVTVKKVKLKLADKRANLELLGKYLKIFSDATPAPDKYTAEVLEQVLSEDLSPREAAYKLQIKGIALPKVLELELSKKELNSPEDERPPITSEVLEQRYLEALAEAERQKERFLPARREEVRQMREEMKHLEQFVPVGQREDV